MDDKQHVNKLERDRIDLSKILEYYGLSRITAHSAAVAVLANGFTKIEEKKE